MARLTDLVVISGFSGAGKSSAMNVFDDAGYFCVDNLPAGMIRSLAALFLHEGSKIERACVVSDLRAGDYLEVLAEVLDDLDSAGHVTTRLLFLEADEDSLLTRYKETRRRHPQARNGNVADGIHREQDLLAPIRERADTVIDTTGLSASALRRKVASEMLAPGQPGKLAVTFGSFGHKHGPARDADLVFDVRFLPNPHWEADLRPLTGFDRRIIQYVGRDGRLKEFYDRVLPLLEYLLPQYVAEGKAHLVVAIGCTGGRHRSVVIAEDLAAHFRDDGRFFVEVQHRDVDRAPSRS
ncbi:MAG: RNase adapter RapZ [Solirubrobacteraceae bacterium]